jgi:hypothetical protein
VAVASPDLDDEFDKDEFVDEFGGDEPAEPWHNSTRAVVGASAAGLAVVGVLAAAVMYMAGGEEPTDPPRNVIDPSFSETTSASASAATTTTQTITSTPIVSTTEINGPPTPPTSNSGTSSSPTSQTSSSETSTSPSQRTRGGESPAQTSRSRPRLNVTRTLGPGPIG